MEVYTFEKSFLERLEEITLILGENEISLNKVKSEFQSFIEAAIEPCGWNALWKVSKATCEDLGIKFPTEVFGQVDQVLFDDLKAIFNIIAVQDDQIQLPESVIVPLEELFPTKTQEEKSLNIDLTAEVIDRYRFFQNYIWFAWDEELENNEMWNKTKYLMPRLKLYYDLKNKSISKSLSSHIRRLIQESKYLQKKKDNLEVTINDDDEDMAGDTESVTKLLKLHLRLNKIKHELEILMNPEMRKIYENMEGFAKPFNPKKHQVFVVATQGTLTDQIEFLDSLKSKILEKSDVQMSSKLQEALMGCQANNEIYLPAGTHIMNFLEYLNGSLTISGVKPYALPKFPSTEDLDKIYSVISANDQDSLLLAVDGDLKLENLIIDCDIVKTGILIKNGNVTIKNCLIHGDSKSSITEGLSILNEAVVTIENSVITNFALGMSVNDSAKLILKDSIITKCCNSLQSNGKCEIVLDNSSIVNSKEFGVTKMIQNLENGDKVAVMDEIDNQELEKLNLSLTGACKFEGNKRGNFVIYNNSQIFQESSFFEAVDDL